MKIIHNPGEWKATVSCSCHAVLEVDGSDVKCGYFSSDVPGPGSFCYYVLCPVCQKPNMVYPPYNIKNKLFLKPIIEFI